MWGAAPVVEIGLPERDRELHFEALGPGSVQASSRAPAADADIANAPDLPALTGPGSELVYAASWFMGNPSLGTMISGAGGR